MSRLESDFFRPQRDWYDIDELVHRVISGITKDNSTHIFNFSTEDNLPLFWVDGLLLEQIVRNILQNALLYTPTGTVVNIEALQEEKGLLLKISDNGPGFPDDKLEQVFGKFYRLPRSATGGTGLGLSISRGFAQAHGGNIKLENLKEGGAKFTIFVPAETTSLTPKDDE